VVGVRQPHGHPAQPLPPPELLADIRIGAHDQPGDVGLEHQAHVIGVRHRGEYLSPHTE